MSQLSKLSQRLSSFIEKVFFGVTTNGAPVLLILLIKHSFINPVDKKIRHTVINFSWHFHLDILYVKISNSASNDILSIATKLVSFLFACFSTMHRQFRFLLQEVQSSLHT